MGLTFAQALEHIYGFTDYEVKPQYRYAPDVIDPTRPARLLERLGNPHCVYPSIHVAGTKGKGSVAAIMASALNAAGLRVGLYTSPHLVEFTERIQIDGVEVDQGELAGLVEEIMPAVAEVEGVTTFEVITVLAFLIFARRAVDVAVIEVGLGGRLDATNVITPLVSVVTSLSYDHTFLLGDTLAEIAFEKGGIIKQGVPVVSAPQERSALATLKEIALDRRAPLTLVGRDWWYEAQDFYWSGQTFRAGRTGHSGDRYRLSLLGEHQLVNATVALATLDLVRPVFPTLDRDAVARGLAQVSWPGRFQILNREPAVVVDGAHNGDSAVQLSKALERYFPDRRRILVLGVTADKDVKAIVRALLPVADEVIVTAANHPRASTPEALAKILEAEGASAVAVPSVGAALNLALETASVQDVICLTGSLFVVGEALTAWVEVGRVDSLDPAPSAITQAR